MNQCLACGSYKNHSVITKGTHEFLHCPYCESEWETRKSYVPVDSENRLVNDKVLTMAQRALALLENQASGYTSLSMPVHLQIALEDKRREVAEMLQGKR